MSSVGNDAPRLRPLRSRRWPWRAIGIALVTLLGAPADVRADDDVTPGFPEKIVQWGVQSGETCEDISKALYGSAAHTGLLLRYNRIVCVRGAPLKTGMTLVLPAKVTNVPTARITSVNPDTRSRPAGGGWSPAQSGQPLSTNSNVNTLEDGRAGIQFVDRSRVYLAAHTLVVIYGTASQTAVSKTPPPKVELESGELQAGLAALRGDAVVDVGVSGGGRVSAQSRDTVLRKKDKRTTVAVFDGKADVSSGGKAVTVPLNHGSAFVEAKAPTPPRPLPPAPAGDAGGSPPVVLAPSGQALLSASWQAVAKAASYRLEVARDADFQEVVVREEIPAKVRAFRAERFPVGSYHMRVRAIDGEDFLGIASAVRRIDVVAGDWQRASGSLQEGVLRVSPYGAMAMKAAPSLELALDDGAFGPVPELLDFAHVKPTRLRLRNRGSSEVQELSVQYLPPEVTIALEPLEGSTAVRVTFAQVEGIDVAGAIGPKARAHLSAGIVDVALEPNDGSFVGSFSGEPPADQPLRVDVVDRDGRLLGSTAHAPPTLPTPDEPAPVEEPPEPPWIGPTVPAHAWSARTNVWLWSPTARPLATLGAMVDSGSGDGASVQGEAYAAGPIGPVGIDALLRTRSESGEADTSAWLGLQWRAYRLGQAELELGPGLRVGFPLDDSAPPPQLEPSFAIGGVVGRWGWLANLGGRIRLMDDRDRAPIDAGQGFLLVSGRVDATDWLRLHSVVDAHVLVDDGALFRGGLGLGVEAGTVVFVSLTGRASPWQDVGGHVSGQLGLGLRGF